MSEKNNQSEEIVRSFLSLLRLEKSARQARKLDELQFIIANETRHILFYEQATLWVTTTTGKNRVRVVSGISHPDTSSPYFQHLHQLLDAFALTEEAKLIVELKKENFSSQFSITWDETALQNPLWCPFINSKGYMIGGLMFTRESEWNQAEISQLQFLVDAYAHAWGALEKRNISWRNRLNRSLKILHNRTIRISIALAIVALMFLPVSQSVIAPAEVVPSNPHIISPPVDGIVKEFYVQPNEAVEKGQRLFSLEDRDIRNNFIIAKKALAVTKANYKSTVQKSFTDPESKARVPVLKSLLEQKEAEVAYSSDLLKRIVILAPEDGIAIFSDHNDWLGRPVLVGEKIITLANPTATELQIWLPVDNAINMEADARVRSFLNVNPTHPLEAVLRQFSFEAQASPDEILSFQLRASFTDKTAGPRIGLKATAKLYGDRVTLFYYISRRPMAGVRRFLGW